MGTLKKKRGGSGSMSPTPLPNLATIVDFAVLNDNVGHLPVVITRGKCRWCNYNQNTFSCDKC